jgi:hypothetical protein
MAAMCIDLPEQIHERLRERAKEDKRSMRQTILIALERLFDEETKRSSQKRGRSAI